MIDTISVTFNKKTNNFNIPFAIITKKNKKESKKNGDGRSSSAVEMSRPQLNNDDPYSNVIGIQALFSQDNILDFNKFDGEDIDLFIENEINQLERDDAASSAFPLGNDKQTTKFINKYTKLYIKSITKNITNTSEVIPKGLYDKGLMVELSYAIQHAQTNEHIEDANEDFMAQLQNQNLEFYPNLSNRNSAVINDPIVPLLMIQ